MINVPPIKSSSCCHGDRLLCLRGIVKYTAFGWFASLWSNPPSPKQPPALIKKIARAVKPISCVAMTETER